MSLRLQGGSDRLTALRSASTSKIYGGLSARAPACLAAQLRLVPSFLAFLQAAGLHLLQISWREGIENVGKIGMYGSDTGQVEVTSRVTSCI